MPVRPGSLVPYSDTEESEPEEEVERIVMPNDQLGPPLDEWEAGHITNFTTEDGTEYQVDDQYPNFISDGQGGEAALIDDDHPGAIALAEEITNLDYSAYYVLQPEVANGHSQRLRTSFVAYSFKFNEQALSHAPMNIESLMPRVLEAAVTEIATRNNIDSNATVGIDVYHTALRHNIIMPYLPLCEFSSERLLELIENVMQSRSDVTFDDTMIIKLQSTLSNLTLFVHFSNFLCCF